LFNPYTKAILSAMLAFLTALATSWDDSELTTTEITTAIGIGIAALMAVWAAPVQIKWLVSGLLAGISALAVALGDDAISAQEWITIIVATLGALAIVYQTPNTFVSNAPAVALPKKTPVVESPKA
jgi:Na+-transporting NADH:ubiquinone oxidoreductase subunit NqrE